MKTCYDSFVLCKSNRNTYIITHNVMKSRYTNVKYHCEISWYFTVHCLPQSLRNYKEEAEIKPSEKALAMPGQSFQHVFSIFIGYHVINKSLLVPFIFVRHVAHYSQLT